MIKADMSEQLVQLYKRAAALKTPDIAALEDTCELAKDMTTIWPCIFACLHILGQEYHLTRRWQNTTGSRRLRVQQQQILRFIGDLLHQSLSTELTTERIIDIYDTLRRQFCLFENPQFIGAMPIPSSNPQSAFNPVDYRRPATDKHPL
jgi:hypothetical protein